MHPLGDGLVALGGGRGCGAIDGGQEGGAVGGEQGGVGGQGLGGVVDIALAAGGQAGAGEGVVEGGAEGVDIGPGTHVAIGGALLGGAEAGGFDDAVAEIAVGFAGGAEIDDDGEAGAGDEDVVGFDVAVQQLAAVQVVERIEQAHHEAEEAGLGDGGAHGGMLGGEFIERDAVDELDHVVGGAVFLEVGVDFGDAGVVERGEEAHFAQEVAEGPVVGFLAGVGVVHADIECAFLAVAEGIGEAFLDHDAAVEQGFLREVGDAEAAAAYGALHSVAMQQGAGGEFLGRNGAGDFFYGGGRQGAICREGERHGVKLGAFLARGGEDAFHEIACGAADHGGVWRGNAEGACGRGFGVPGAAACGGKEAAAGRGREAGRCRHCGRSRGQHHGRGGHWCICRRGGVWDFRHSFFLL